MEHLIFDHAAVLNSGSIICIQSVRFFSYFYGPSLPLTKPCLCGL